MLRALLHIDLIENISHHYHHEIVDWTKAEYPNASVFDFDNLSDSSMVIHAIKLLELSDKIIIIFTATTQSTGAGILGLVEKIIKNKNKVKVVLNGENNILKKMLHLMGEACAYNLKIEDQQEAIRDFFDQ